jgi:hypothetical protein
MRSSIIDRRPSLRLAPDWKQQRCSHDRARASRQLFPLVYVVASSPPLVFPGCLLLFMHMLLGTTWCWSALLQSDDVVFDLQLNRGSRLCSLHVIFAV